MEKSKEYDISFIIPCYKSEKTIVHVIDEISETAEKMSIFDYEIICVDDCSPDDVYRKLVEIATTDTHLKVIRFSRNFGQHAGMIAGVQHSKGKVCVFLDDDGQCPLDKLDNLLQPLDAGYDVAMASYGKKKQSKFKNVGSRFNAIVANILIDKPKDIQMTNFIALKRFVADEISRYHGPYPYISGLLFRSSAKVINVPMEERTRMAGGTTYTLRKLVALWVNSFTAFSIKPLRIATIIGGGASIIGVIVAVITVIRKLMNPAITTGWSSTISVILVLGGLILFVLGIIGEYVGRIYMSINETPQYVIAETCNIDQ
ncbi:MAG: glycosyltransferase family 2 protein [Lachnospiraceae bacterium]|nr:glycosyltransferase family 2 protein [Lachnospiraceae bacterium]